MRNSWPEKNLGECCIEKPSYGANVSSVEYQKDLPRYLRITDIDDYGNLIESNPKSIELKAAEGNYLKRGDIVFARSGATVGKTYLHRSNETLAYAGYLIRFRPNQNVILPEYLFSFTQSDHYKIWIKNNLRAGAQPNINAQEYSSLRFPLPPLPEQRKIIAILRAWDEGIEKLENLLQIKKSRKKSIQQKLLTGKLRLAEFDSSWKHEKLKNLTKETRDRNQENSLGIDKVMGVNKTHGLIPMREETIGATLDRYKIVPPKAFAYNPMRINIGSLARSYKTENVLVSPDYVVFTCLDRKLDTDYFDHFRRSHIWKKFMEAAGNGSVRIRIYYDDLGTLKFKLPEFKEQQSIARFLNIIDQEIKILEKKLAVYRNQKRGLMQKLLTGKWRVKGAEL